MLKVQFSTGWRRIGLSQQGESDKAAPYHHIFLFWVRKYYPTKSARVSWLRNKYFWIEVKVTQFADDTNINTLHTYITLFRVAYAAYLRAFNHQMRDHHTGNYVPYSFRTVCGFFSFLLRSTELIMKSCETGPTVFQISLSNTFN